MKISPARTRAFDILLDIERIGTHSSALLAEADPALDQRDRALCHEIVLGTLRNLILLDHAAGSLSSRPLKKLDLEVLTAIRIGLYQLRFLDKVPDFAAVSESVQLVIRAGKRSAAGLVNAVLRKASNDWPDEPDHANAAAKLSLNYSHPSWLVERWIRNFGESGAEELLAFDNSQHPSGFRLTKKFDLLPEEERSGIIAKIREEPGVEISEIADGGFRAVSRSGFVLELAAEGLAYFQDEGSQLVAMAAAPTAGGSFLDVCAAPGSKTTLVARLLAPGEGRVTACDISPSRTLLLKRICAAQGAGDAAVVRADAETALPFEPRSFDSVLVDAPCTGTGTIAQNPEIRYRLTPEDLVRLPDKQLAILRNASKVVKSGGLLLYSTCSLEPEENAEVSRKFLGSASEFDSEAPNVPRRFLDAQGFASVLPQRDGIAGFFIAAFRCRR